MLLNWILAANSPHSPLFMRCPGVHDRQIQTITCFMMEKGGKISLLRRQWCSVIIWGTINVSSWVMLQRVVTGSKRIEASCRDDGHVLHTVSSKSLPHTRVVEWKHMCSSTCTCFHFMQLYTCLIALVTAYFSDYNLSYCSWPLCISKFGDFEFDYF